MFTEVKEMIDSTIYENGKGEVTAQNVNLAMHGIVDAAEEAVSTLDGKLTTETSNREALEERVKTIEENGTGGGSQPIVVYLGIINEDGSWSLTEEEKANNAEAFKVIKESRCLMPVFVDATRTLRPGVEEYAEVLYSYCAICRTLFVQYAHTLSDGIEMEAISIMSFDVGDITLLPDGTFYTE